MASESSSLLATPPRGAYWRGDIDGLRAVAVLAVLLYHVDNAWCPGGYMVARPSTAETARARRLSRRAGCSVCRTTST